MIRDQYLRIIFIPLLGLLIPLTTGFISYGNYGIIETIAAHLYFILISYCIWIGCNWIHARFRTLYKVSANPFLKITSLCFVTALFGTCIGTSLVLVWMKISGETFTWDQLYLFLLFTALAVIIFTLIYEVLYLSKERQIDDKVVTQLDAERSRAEMTALKNELDPHFIFNSLTTLSYLIVHDQKKAHMFNERLARVFKYFLINKDRELISLENELEFIDSYFFLLQIRHDEKLQLNTQLESEQGRRIMILPCALQILVENAIKHNEFSEKDPLNISIALNGQYLKVINNVKPKPYLVNSTKIGLRNLSSRYRLVCKRDIIVENTNRQFVVKLPLINN